MSLNSTVVAGLVTQDLARNIVISSPLTDGSVHPKNTAILSSSPQHTITSLDIDTMITLCGSGGGAIAGVCNWYDAKIAATGGAKTAGSTHTKGNYATGYIKPDSLTVGAQTVAQMSATLMGLGTSEPVTITADSALAGTDGTPKQYGMGPLAINGTTYTQITDVNINFGVTETTDVSDGNIGPRDAKTQSAKVVVTITTTDMDALQDAVDGGIALDGSDGFVLYLRQRSQDGTAYLTGTNHIKIEILDGIIVPESNSGNEAKTSTFRIEGRYESQNPVVLTSGESLPS